MEMVKVCMTGTNAWFLMPASEIEDIDRIREELLRPGGRPRGGSILLGLEFDFGPGEVGDADHPARKDADPMKLSAGEEQADELAAFARDLKKVVNDIPLD